MLRASSVLATQPPDKLKQACSCSSCAVIYLSDFDPGGRSMPKAVARKVEFTIAKFELDVDLEPIPFC